MRRPRPKFKVSFHVYFGCFWLNVTQINFENIKRKYKDSFLIVVSSWNRDLMLMLKRPLSHYWTSPLICVQATFRLHVAEMGFEHFLPQDLLESWEVKIICFALAVNRSNYTTAFQTSIPVGMMVLPLKVLFWCLRTRQKLTILISTFISIHNFSFSYLYIMHLWRSFLSYVIINESLHQSEFNVHFDMLI